MPTKQEQSDLWAILYGSHGDTVRIALAPSSVEESFYDTATAFNLADKYQCPVFIVTDLSLSLNKQTVEDLDISKITIDRGELLTDEEIAAQAEEDGFRALPRHRVGHLAAAFAGQPKGQYLATGVEHNEFGKVSEDPKNRVAMMDKRMRKIPTGSHARWASTASSTAVPRRRTAAHRHRLHVRAHRRRPQGAGAARPVRRPRPRAGAGAAAGGRAERADGQGDASYRASKTTSKASCPSSSSTRWARRCGSRTVDVPVDAQRAQVRRHSVFARGDRGRGERGDAVC